MESITFEMCAATSDPADRTLGVLVRSGDVLCSARSFRLPPEWPIGTALLWVDRLVLEWARPRLTEQDGFLDLLEQLEQATSPF